MRRRTFLRASVLSIVTALSLYSRVAASTPPRFVPLGAPRQLVIPKIGVRASVESLSFNKKPELMAPYRWGDVAWFNRGPRPGELGRAQIYGHVDSTCCPAVFYRLRELKHGDVLSIQYPGAGPLVFKVQWQGTFLNARTPDKFFYARTQERGLIMVTCAGVFHHDGTGYDHKLVVYATLVTPVTGR